MNTKTIQSFKHMLKESGKTRNIVRQKYWTQKYDLFILNGLKVSYAVQRLILLSPLIISALEKKDTKSVANAKQKLSVCLKDCMDVSKLQLLPDDKKMKDHLIKVVQSTDSQLINLGTKK